MSSRNNSAETASTPLPPAIVTILNALSTTLRDIDGIVATAQLIPVVETEIDNNVGLENSAETASTPLPPAIVTILNALSTTLRDIDGIVATAQLIPVVETEIDNNVGLENSAETASTPLPPAIVTILNALSTTLRDIDGIVATAQLIPVVETEIDNNVGLENSEETASTPLPPAIVTILNALSTTLRDIDGIVATAQLIPVVETEIDNNVGLENSAETASTPLPPAIVTILNALSTTLRDIDGIVATAQLIPVVETEIDNNVGLENSAETASTPLPPAIVTILNALSTTLRDIDGIVATAQLIPVVETEIDNNVGLENSAETASTPLPPAIVTILNALSTTLRDIDGIVATAQLIPVVETEIDNNVGLENSEETASTPLPPAIVTILNALSTTLRDIDGIVATAQLIPVVETEIDNNVGLENSAETASTPLPPAIVTILNALSTTLRDIDGIVATAQLIPVVETEIDNNVGLENSEETASTPLPPAIVTILNALSTTLRDIDGIVATAQLIPVVETEIDNNVGLENSEETASTPLPPAIVTILNALSTTLRDIDGIVATAQLIPVVATETDSEDTGICPVCSASALNENHFH